MIEKVNPMHPDKIADRIAGAIVDLAYKQEENPKIAVEVLIGHNLCQIIIESNIDFREYYNFENKNNIEVLNIVERIAGITNTYITQAPQDKHLAENQSGQIRCGDNGIFKGVPLTREEKEISQIAHTIYEKYPYDGKYILDKEKTIICQSNAIDSDVAYLLYKKFGKPIQTTIINPLGYWTGGLGVDSGATNRKLGSDMAQSVTGGGLHGKDLSKADVSVNIYCFLLAQELGHTITACCAIGDENITFNVVNKLEHIEDKITVPYSQVVEVARTYIKEVGGFEKFAEWGLF